MSEVSVVAGSVEYLYADIRADRVLNTQAVSISISETNDPAAWQPATWTGAAARFRAARILLDGSLPEGVYNVYARITDSPEVPILHVGKLRVT